MSLASLLSKLFPTPVRPEETGFALQPNLSADDGWLSVSRHRHERPYSEIQELYSDSLTAWRKNPMAWRIISTTVNYVVGKGIALTSPVKSLNRFIQDFWIHRQNNMDMRLIAMVEELSRSGDLFVLLFRNSLDGMSYIRFITKDQILRIESLPNDWETEIAYYEAPQPGMLTPRKWLSPAHPDSRMAEAVMLHYAVNKPMGALMGESDLTTIIPWLLRYSRMLEDRVRLHWAARAFLYLVTVPSNKVESKSVQYSSAPESGSIIVKDESETWETITPSLRGADASHDMKAVRSMIDAGSGFPPHWRGEGGDVNFATAEAMQDPPEKFLIKRQQYFIWLLEDICYQAYMRAVELGMQAALDKTSYAELFKVSCPDVSLRDNLQLAEAASKLAAAFSSLQGAQLGHSPTLQRIALDLVLKFAGEPQEDAELDRIISEAQAETVMPVPSPDEDQDPGQGGD